MGIEMDCTQELAHQMINLMKQGKSISEITKIYDFEDADLVGGALIKAQKFYEEHKNDHNDQN